MRAKSTQEVRNTKVRKKKVLKRRYSLKRNKNFRRVYRRGKSFPSQYFVLLKAKGRPEALHVGLSVSKRLGKSVVRNRVKRRMRAAFSPLIAHMKTGYDLILIAREPVVHAPFRELEKALQKLLQKASLLREDENAAAGGPSRPLTNGAKKERE